MPAGAGLPRLTGGAPAPDAHPRLTGKGGKLAAQERFVVPHGSSDVVNARPAKMNTAPAKMDTKPAKFTGPQYQGKRGSGVLGEVAHVVARGAENVADSFTKPQKPYSFTEKGVTVRVPAGPGLGGQAAALGGLPTEAVTHPLRFIHDQRKLSPQQKANSAIGLHLVGGLLGMPAAGHVVGAAEKKGLSVAFSGGGKDEKGLPAAASDLRGAFRGAKVVRGKQEAGYSVERGKRFAAASEHLNNQSLDPAQRLALAKGELRGELPKINFQGFSELNDQSIKHLQTYILDHPHLMPGQKIRAADALTNALAGKVPTRSELTLLQHIFGKETADGLGQVATHPFKDTLLSILNVPRSLMASFDLSAPFRQGLVVSTRHPSIFFRNFKPMVKAFGSEKVYQGVLSDIHSRPSYPMMVEAKLAITELTKNVGSREEHFASDVAEKIPVVGHGVRASGRAYTGYLDKVRADVFDHLLEQAKSQGINVQDEKFLKGLGSYINSATGRGDLGHFQEAGKVLNTFFFSPRLLASRLNFMNPLYYARLDPFARKEALRSAIQLAGTMSTLLALASRIPGVTVVADPRNPDWGKIKVGNTRIDIAGGFQQPLRLFAQLATGTAISSTTGKKLNLTANGFGQPTRLDLLMRFFEGKEAPWASLVTDKLRNSDQVGNQFKWSSEMYSRMIPLLAQDSYDLYNAKQGGMNGLAAAFAGYGVGSVGFGLQTYGPKQKGGKFVPTGNPAIDRILQGGGPSFGVPPQISRILNKP